MVSKKEIMLRLIDIENRLDIVEEKLVKPKRKKKNETTK